MLASQLTKQNGKCSGFVVMPDHVHALVWFPATRQLGHFMKQWKQRSSVQIKKLLRERLMSYAGSWDLGAPVWQARYYPFSVYSTRKAIEKLDYMHLNPVKAGLVEAAADWRYSSARHYEYGQSVGVPIEWIFEGVPQ